MYQLLYAALVQLLGHSFFRLQGPISDAKGEHYVFQIQESNLGDTNLHQLSFVYIVGREKAGESWLYRVEVQDLGEIA